MAPAKAEMRITAIQPIDAYRVKFVFSDGHQRGIFPWVFIRGLEDQKLLDAIRQMDDLTVARLLLASSASSED